MTPDERRGTAFEAVAEPAVTSEGWRGGAIEAAEERRGDAIEAAAQCRDDQAERVPEPEGDGERGYRVVWVDSGSGPGFEVLVPADD